MPELNWLGDRKAKQAARQVPYRLLQPVEHVGDPASDNLLIQGDNLDALKSLLPLYAGRVKCIFIDPPYNTKSAFEHYDDNLEHSQWLSMMYPRLELLRELLSEDGSIWVTIDDNEGHYLKVVMDEVFGRSNFLQTVIWFRKVSPANDAKHFSNDHDFVLVYGKSTESVSLNRLERQESHNKAYTNPDNDPRGPWNSVTLTGNKSRDERPNLYYSVRNPNTGAEILPPANLTWRASRDRYENLVVDGLIYWGKDGKSKSPRIKRFLTEAKPVIPRSVWHYDESGHTQEAMTESKVLFGKGFGTPKAERLLQRVIEIATNPNDLVLDSFLGSGTTAAVAHKMGRRWIGIEMGEHARTHCLPRLTKVVEGEQGGISAAVNWHGGGGFRFMRLGEPVFEQDGRISPSVRFAPLAAYLWFVETRVPHAVGSFESPLLGVHGETAIVLLYNGILGDRRPQGGNVLTHAVWEDLRSLLPDHTGPWLVYGEASRLQPATRKHLNIEFKQIPYDIRVR